MVNTFNAINLCRNLTQNLVQDFWGQAPLEIYTVEQKLLKLLSLPSSQCKTNLKATELQNMEFQQTIEELNIQLKRRVSKYEL